MNFISTEPKLHQCIRCNAYVFACHVAGIPTVADVAPLGQLDYVNALLARRSTYDVIERADGTTACLAHRTASSTWGRRSVLAEHPCTGWTTKEVETTAVPMLPLVADTLDYAGILKGSHVSNATRARSSDWRPALCCECRGFFTEDDLFVGYYVSASLWWASHVEGECNGRKAKVKA